ADIIGRAIFKNGVRVISERIDLPSADAIKQLSFELKSQFNDLVFLAAAEIEGKAHLSLIISESLVDSKKLNATNMIRDLAKSIEGGGGGQPFYATAGGKKPAGIDAALSRIHELVG
ncbi:MAG: DHHA1 domain-containing protein, partial [Bacteroidota bacterium]